MKLDEYVDPETDRVVTGYVKVRNLKYNNIGVTATDKFTFKDAQEIMKKIEVRIDRDVEHDQDKYRVKIGKEENERIYDIERIYVREDDRIMELSLSYAD